MHALLGHITPDPIGQLLDTGYDRFSAPAGVDGLAKEHNRRLDLLAVASRDPGQGCFRRFIEQAKAHYDAIYVWEVVTPALDVALRRYGFHPTTQTEPDGEVLTGYAWRRAAAPENAPDLDLRDVQFMHEQARLWALFGVITLGLLALLTVFLLGWWWFN